MNSCFLENINKTIFIPHKTEKSMLNTTTFNNDNKKSSTILYDDKEDIIEDILSRFSKTVNATEATDDTSSEGCLSDKSTESEDSSEGLRRKEKPKSRLLFNQNTMNYLNKKRKYSNTNTNNTETSKNTKQSSKSTDISEKLISTYENSPFNYNISINKDNKLKRHYDHQKTHVILSTPFILSKRGKTRKMTFHKIHNKKYLHTPYPVKQDYKEDIFNLENKSLEENSTLPLHEKQIKKDKKTLHLFDKNIKESHQRSGNTVIMNNK